MDKPEGKPDFPLRYELPTWSEVRELENWLATKSANDPDPVLTVLSLIGFYERKFLWERGVKKGFKDWK